MTQVLQVFARAPVPGECKTRLIPALGPNGAAKLHERLVRQRLDIRDVHGEERIAICVFSRIMMISFGDYWFVGESIMFLVFGVVVLAFHLGLNLPDVARIPGLLLLPLRQRCLALQRAQVVDEELPVQMIYLVLKAAAEKFPCRRDV